jgi:tetratricopeptide (TPR) repeat protein
MDFAGHHLDLGYYTGLSYLLLNEPAAAAAAFQDALDSLAPERLKARAILMLSLAMAAAADRRHDQAAATASEALTIADDQPIGRIWNRVEDVRRAVAASPSSARELDEHMVNFAGALERADAAPAP